LKVIVVVQDDAMRFSKRRARRVLLPIPVGLFSDRERDLANGGLDARFVDLSHTVYM
jgi:hypothetical protein